MRAELFFLTILCYLFQYVTAGRDISELCQKNTNITRSCTTQILGEDYLDVDSCQVVYIPPNRSDCIDEFGPISSNSRIGGVSLKPYISPVEIRNKHTKLAVNYTILNITFSNIKWKTMKFRFSYTNGNKVESHCRNIVISNNITINDQSVLYYDCYWLHTYVNYNGPSHVLDFEASDDYIINRGRYFFNIPNEHMVGTTVSIQDWKPFVYIEILTSTMRLHIMPPPSHLKITAFLIEVMKECAKGTQCEELVQNSTIKLKNNTQEVTYDYSLLKPAGYYYFVVTPIHENCRNKEIDECQSVKSPKISISSEIHQTLNICIASITALIVATLFAYYIVLRMVRRYWCQEYGNEIPPPTKVLVVYSTANRLHAECVASFVTYLRSEYGFDVMYDGDISNTSHADPYIWAEEAFTLASHVVYVVGPAENSNLYNNIYDKPIAAHRNVDTLILTLLKANRVSRCPKDVMNVFFEYSNGQLPIETRHDKVFFLLKDWQKLIAYLSRNLLPKKQLMRTEKGKNFLEDLTRAKKLLSGNDDVVVKCEKSLFEKKVLL